MSLAAALVDAVRLARDVTGRRALLLSGSLDPRLAAAIADGVAPAVTEIERLAPDPLAIEDLFGRLDADLAALVVQSPDPFGACRPFTPLAALCREFTVPLVAVLAHPLLPGRDGLPPADLVVLPEAPWPEPGPAWIVVRPGFAPAPEPPPPPAAATLAAAAERLAADTDRLVTRLRRVRGLRVVSRAPFAAVAVHLGDDRPAEAVAAAADLPGLAVTPLSRLYPGWPELEPVLILRLTAPLDPALLDRLAAVLAG